MPTKTPAKLTIDNAVLLTLLAPVIQSFSKRAVQWFDTSRAASSRYVGEVRATEASDAIIGILEAADVPKTELYYFDPMRIVQDLRNRALTTSGKFSAAEIARVLTDRIETMLTVGT